MLFDYVAAQGSFFLFDPLRCTAYPHMSFFDCGPMHVIVRMSHCVYVCVCVCMCMCVCVDVYVLCISSYDFFDESSRLGLCIFHLCV
jgi:hypothetical protein